MESLVHDLRYAVREITRRPGFTVLALLTLAMGIGAATTMYSVIHNVLLNPFPYTDPRRMVDVIIQNLENPRRFGALTIPEFRAFVDESNVFQEAVGTSPTQMLYRTDHGLEQFTVARVTPNLFHFLGVPALLGHTINAEDAKAGSPRVAVLSHKVRMTYFGGDSVLSAAPFFLTVCPSPSSVSCRHDLPGTSPMRGYQMPLTIAILTP